MAKKLPPVGGTAGKSSVHRVPVDASLKRAAPERTTVGPRQPSITTHLGSVRDVASSALRAVGVPREELENAMPVDLGLLNEQPLRFQTELLARFGKWCPRILVRGTLDQRLLVLEGTTGQWLAADLSGRALGSRVWPTWTRGHLLIHEPGASVSLLDVDEDAGGRLSRPKVLISALYHPEFFPLPRFPLGISDLARAARATLLGEVELLDMQLGATVDSIRTAVATDRPDILGVSATFGQHDLMVSLLGAVYDHESPPLIIAGGSLTVRNEPLLLDRYPKLLIARGAGESTIADLMAYWHNDIAVSEVRGLSYMGAAQQGRLLVIGTTRTPTVPNRATTEALPELDLLDATFENHGVAQLEASRGCGSACSFCPRGHKGTWAGSPPGDLTWLLDAFNAAFRRHPSVSRTLYLVDEEFIGQGEDAVHRAIAVAESLDSAGLQWETSCRIDQVVLPDNGTYWHVERAHMWRRLLQLGLRRCLFGVESGVDSILTRFNKGTTGKQNALAIRTLSALGVPSRFTYITFDPLMTLEELEATYAFQGRRDLIILPQPSPELADIVGGVRDPSYVAEHAWGRPFYTEISYMLVSMECLIGAAYTRQVRAAGLARAPRPSMGRLDSTYADWRIGAASERAQLWVDGNFALDYTLKSLEKVVDGEPRHAVRHSRSVLKEAGYQLLGQMIERIKAIPVDQSAANRAELESSLFSCAESLTSDLHTRMTQAADVLRASLPDDRTAVLDRELTRWLMATERKLINAADPCGT